VVNKPQLILKGNLLFELIRAPFVYTHFLLPPTSFVIIIQLLCPGMGPFFKHILQGQQIAYFHHGLNKHTFHMSWYIVFYVLDE
jgi:hypothetical protein